MGRFINADAFVSTGQGLLGNNMFAYCLNNPVNMLDTTGNFPWLVVGFLALTTIIGGVLASTSDQQLLDNQAEGNIPEENTSPTLSYSAPSEREQDILSEYKPDVLPAETPSTIVDNETTTLTTGDRVMNTVIGCSLGLASGALAVASVGAGMVILGAQAGAQIFALGASAYDAVAIIVAPFIGADMEPIEIEP